MSSITVGEVAQQLGRWFPSALAESWDNVGLLLGSANDRVHKIMTCLTLSRTTAEEAVKSEASLIVSHHPIFFRPTKRLTDDGPDGFIYQLARNGVAVYSPHTSFDGAELGINAMWAELLGLKEILPLRPQAIEQFKLVVFLPESDLKPLSQAVFSAGGGIIGAYSECGFRTEGTGTFLGNETTNPTVGKAGRREEASELRWETIVPAHRIAAVISAVRSTHSYEEPAFDVYPLRPGSSQLGGGRMGKLDRPMPLKELARTAANLVQSPQVEFAGPHDGLCAKVAIGCGAATEFLDDAVKAGCDALVTGEARFHDYVKAENLGVGLIAVGHYASERFAVEKLADRLMQTFPKIETWASKEERDARMVLNLTETSG